MLRIHVVLALALLSLTESAALADEVRLGTLAITNAWARPTLGRTPNGAGYLTITNHGQEADRLVSAQSPASSKVELHTIVAEGNVRKMRPIPAIEIEPGRTVELKPGGFHVMLLGLKRPLSSGKTIPLTVTFEKAGSVTVEVAVGHGDGAGQGEQSSAPMQH